MEPGVGSISVFGRLRGEDPVDLIGLGEAKAVERHGIGIVLRIEVHRSHGDAGPVAPRNFKPVGKKKRFQSHASDRDCVLFASVARQRSPPAWGAYWLRWESNGKTL